jgi:hypothetical protein
LLVASSSFFGSSTKGALAEASIRSLTHGSVAVSMASEGVYWAGVGNRVGVGVSSPDFFVAGGSSPGSKTGMTSWVAL